MTKPMKLRGTVKLENNGRLTFHSTQADDSAFSVSVDQFDVQLNEEFLPSKITVEGFLFLTQNAEQHEICFCTMPKPSLTHGRNITVKKSMLSPRHISIKDFNPSTSSSEESE